MTPEETYISDDCFGNGAEWHISYYSDYDKKRIETVMGGLNCQSFKLYQGVDNAISTFRI